MAIKRDAADTWFSKCVRLRAGWKCEHTGRQFTPSDSGLHCAHIYGRRNKSTRWDMDNAVSLSASSHRYFTENPVEFFHWLDAHLGEGHMEVLSQKRNTILKTTKAIRSEIAAHYRQEYRQAEQDENYKIVSY